MSKVKQVLAGILSASMIVTLMPAVTFAADTSATVTITHGSSTYDYKDLTSPTDIKTAIADAKAGDTVTVTGNVNLNDDSAKAKFAGSLFADNADTITLDVSGAKFEGTGAWFEYADYTDTVGESTVSISANKVAEGVYVYSKAYYAVDGSNMVINFPNEYVASGLHGITVSFKMANGKTYTAEPTGGTYQSYGNLLNFEGTETKVENEDAKGFRLSVSDAGSTSPSCTEAGTVEITATVTTWNAAGNALPYSSSKNYGEVEALGHDYGTLTEDKVLILPEYKAGNVTNYNGYGVQIAWGIRGSGTAIAVSKDGDYTTIESLKTVCLRDEATHGYAHSLENAKSYKITNAVAGTPASSNSVGSTVYTLEVVTADDATVTVQQTVWDVPALAASNIGVIKDITFETYEYTYEPSNDTFTKKGSAKWLGTLYPDYTCVSGKWYKTEITADGDINYVIDYYDALATTKPGKIEGTLKAATDVDHKATIASCGVNTFYYEPVTVSVAVVSTVGEGADAVKVISGAENIKVGADDENGATAAEKTVNSAWKNNHFMYKVPTTGAFGITGSGDSTAWNKPTAEATTGVYAYAATHNHTHDMNNGTYATVKNPTTVEEGFETITCKECTNPNMYVVLPTTTTGIVYAKVAEGTGTAKAWTNADVVTDIAKAYKFEKKATCTTAGYSYNLAVDVDANKTREIVIEGSEVPATGHDLYIVPADVHWNNKGETEMYAVVDYTCKNEPEKAAGSEVQITYYAKPGKDTDNKKYSAITTEVIKGEDCTKANREVYTITGLTDVLGNAVQDTKDLTDKFGDHNFKNELNWSADGKSATLTQTCQVKGCKAGFDTKPNVVAATVTGAEQADGSTLYTATYNNETVGTKKVFDLSKAVITVKGGETIDMNAYTDANLKKEIETAGSVSVSINDAVIDSSLYEVTATADKSATPATLTVVVTAKDKTDAVNSKTLTLKTNDKNAQLVIYKSFDAPKVLFDGNEKGATGTKYDAEITYDGAAHAVVAKPQADGKDIEAIVKYAVVNVDSVTVNNGTEEAPAYETRYYNSLGKLVDVEKVEFNLDKVELTDSDEYLVYAQISKEGYTTKTVQLDYYYIMPIDLSAKYSLVLSKQTITYGEQLVATTGDEEIDKTIGLEVKDTTKLGVGDYSVARYVSYSDNYLVATDPYSTKFNVEKRNATIVMTAGSKTYDGKEVALKDLFTIDGAINGDELDVIVNSEGNKGLINAGTYQLVATANDSNYKIEKVTATYTIKKAAQTFKSVTPSKKTYKATALKKAKKTFTLKSVLKKGNGKVTYKLSSVPAKLKGKVTVTSAGKVTLKKGTYKKGTYKIKVKATAAATTNYKAKTYTKTITIVIK